MSAYNVGDPGSIPGSGRSPGEGNGNPLQYYSPWGGKESDTTERLHFHFVEVIREMLIRRDVLGIL